MNSCSSCGGPGFRSPPGSQSSAACSCIAGFGGPDCNLCPAATYSTSSSTTAPCVVCPDNTISPAGATSATQCVCKPGFGGLDCNQCLQGSWSAGGTLAACIPCGPNQNTSIVGATSPAYCTCVSGTGGVGCQVCPSGSYSAGGSNANCLACGDFQTTVAPSGKGPEACGKLPCLLSASVPPLHEHALLILQSGRVSFLMMEHMSCHHLHLAYLSLLTGELHINAPHGHGPTLQDLMCSHLPIGLYVLLLCAVKFAELDTATLTPH